MNKYEKIISSINKQTNFLEMVKAGIKPEEIKKTVIELLEPYFENREMLEKYAINTLLGDSILLMKIRKDKFFFDKFKKCIETYRSAKNKKQKECFKSCAFFFNAIIETEIKFWSVANLEVDKNKLELEDALHECLKNIGEIIEGLTKPFLKTFLCQVRISYGINELNSVRAMDLGQVVAELIKKSNCAELFSPPPWNISLSQWRNIAYNHSAKINNENILCMYGREHNLKKIELTKDEMIKAIRVIYNIYSVLKLVYTVFYIDNIQDIMKYATIPEKEPREESIFLNFTLGLASLGYEVVEINKNIEEANLVIRDVSDLDIRDRRAHASQFLFPLWLATHSKNIVIEYRDKNNTPKLLMSIDNLTCEKISNGELDELELARKFKIVILNKSNP
jgi:hypothetical protein